MADIRINIPKDLEDLVRRLSGMEGNIGVFESLADTIAFAASFGYTKGKKQELVDSASNPISQEVFRNKGLDTLINLIAVQGEKDVGELLSSIDRVFIELFNLKESELPWLNTNTDKEWDDFMRKSRLAFYRIYFELIQKGRVLH